MKKYIAIGDIHGCGKTLQKLLNRLQKYDDRIFVFIGDYIDRGPNSKLVFDSIMKFAEQNDCVFLKGNHELMMEEAFDRKFAGYWTRNGGLQTMISMGIKNVQSDMPEPYGSFVKDTLLYYDAEDYFFVHAGLPPMATINQVLENKDLESMLWERSHIDAPKVNWEKPVVFGHTPLSKPMLDGYKIGIDTGCVFHNNPDLGKLTALLLPEKEIIQEKYSEF